MIKLAKRVFSTKKKTTGDFWDGNFLSGGQRQFFQQLNRLRNPFPFFSHFTTLACDLFTNNFTNELSVRTFKDSDPFH